MSPLMPISSTASGSTSGIQNFGQFEQSAPAVGRGAVGNLPHDDVVIEAVPLRQARPAAIPAAFPRRAGSPIPTAPEACRGWPVRRISRNCTSTGDPSCLHQFDHAVALVAAHAAEEAVGEMFGARLARPPQHRQHVRQESGPVGSLPQ